MVNELYKSESHNKRILYNLIRKGRRSKLPTNANYLILYAFLYKYLSDNLKNHLKEIVGFDIKECYNDPQERESLREWALDDLGYFIESYDAYIDQVVDETYADDLFGLSFFSSLKDNIVFSKDNPAQKYFDEIIDMVDNQKKFYGLTHDADVSLLISSYLFSISKLDILEQEFTYVQVYNQLISSRQLMISSTPEYISNILARIVSSQKHDVLNIYDPFLKDASILFNLSQQIDISNIYGKEKNDLNYFYSLIKTFIVGFDFRNVFFFKQNAIESMSVDGNSFDVIVSKIPARFRDNSVLRKQSLEIPKNSKTNVFKEELLSNFDLNELSRDEEVIEALNVLEKKMAKIEKNDVVHFDGEYESLSESDFLFVINMVNSLKDDGIMAISVSQNFLFKNSLTTLRKFLTHENNYIDAIISLPEELDRSIRPEVIIVFKKNKTNKDVLFIDLSSKFNAVPSKNAIRGTFRRNLILANDTLNKLVEVYDKRQTIDKFSNLISLDELEKNNFNLTVSRYVDTYGGEFVRLEDLVKEKHENDLRIRKLNKKIGLMMDDLNIKL